MHSQIDVVSDFKIRNIPVLFNLTMCNECEIHWELIDRHNPKLIVDDGARQDAKDLLKHISVSIVKN